MGFLGECLLVYLGACGLPEHAVYQVFKEVEVVKEVPVEVEKIIEVPVEVEKIVEVPVEVEKVVVQDKIVYVDKEVVKEIPVDRSTLDTMQLKHVDSRHHAAEKRAL